MNIYRFLNSKDISKHLRESYKRITFTTSVLIFEPKQIADQVAAETERTL